MIPKDFKFDIGDGTMWDVHVENFKSSAELDTIMHGEDRKCTVKSYVHHDYFDSTMNRKGDSPSWCGFKDAAELMDMLRNGLDDTSLMRGVTKYAHKAVCAEKDKLAKRCHDVVGGGVDVPEFLSGSPECMLGVKKKKVKSRIVKVAIYCKALCDVDKNEYSHAGGLIAKVIAKLEKAGYRVRLCAVDGYEDDVERKFWIISTLVKRENEPMNYRRVMFPLTQMAYHRGIGFAWMSRNGSPHIWGLGGEIERQLRGDKEERLNALFSQACGTGDYVTFSPREIIGLYREHGDEWTERYLESKLLSLS